MKNISICIADYLQSKVKGFTRQAGRTTVGGWEEWLKNKHGGYTDYLSVTVNESGVIWLDFYLEKELSAVDLNTSLQRRHQSSAKRVKIKKINYKRDFDDKTKAIKAIDNFIKKNM
jgi:hypothetical protein